MSNEQEGKKMQKMKNKNIVYGLTGNKLATNNEPQNKGKNKGKNDQRTGMQKSGEPPTLLARDMSPETKMRVFAEVKQSKGKTKFGKPIESTVEILS